MALDRLDAVVIGAGVEGLVAAAALAKAGRAVTLVERRADTAPMGEGMPAVVGLAAVRALDLTSQGLRFTSAPPVVGIEGDRALVLWPELHAAQAAIAAFSVRDAEALAAFHARIARAATVPAGGDPALVSWLASASLSDGAPSDRIEFRASTLARILDEAFDHDLVKGIWAQGAIVGTGASPLAPGSAILLTRREIAAGVVPASNHRHVAGGAPELRRVLLALLKFYNNADVRFSTEVKEIATERDAASAVVLGDGSVLRVPLVVSTASPSQSRQMLTGLRKTPSEVPASGAFVEPAHVKLTIGALPRLPGVDASTLASGAIVRLNPSIARLAYAHGAFGARALTDTPCLEFTVLPKITSDGKQRWDMHVVMPYVPITTSDGPWTGKRRDSIRALVVRTIDALSPSFGSSIEAAEIAHPPESETVMDPKGAAALTAKAAVDLTGVPEPRQAETVSLIKGLTLLERSLFAGDGDAGLLVGDGAAPRRAKARADA